MDVIEAGHDSIERTLPGRGRKVIIGASVSVLGVAILLGAGNWWREQVSRPDRAEIVSIAAIGPFAISGDDLPEDWPRGLVAGALRLRADVVGDPQGSTQVTVADGGDAYRPSGADGVVVPAGGRTMVDMVVTPTDCGTVDASESPLVDSTGARLPLSGTAREQLGDALRTLCQPGGEAPLLVAESAYVDVFFRDRTLVLTVVVSTPADSVLLAPLDSPGFRAGAQRDPVLRDGRATARLRWLISPAEAEPLTWPVVRVRAFVVSGGRAYPWVITLPATTGVRSSSLTPLRNDGVDLAEVAPRPSR